MNRSRALVSLVAILACAGCTGASQTDAAPSTPEQTETSQAPAEDTEVDEAGDSGDERTISGSGYTYRVPDGWGPLPEAMPGFDPDSVAFDLEDDDDFSDNVNVVLAPLGTMTPAEAETAATDELTAFGAKGVTVNDRVSIAGDEAAHTTAVMSMNDNEYTIDQFFPTHEDQTFVVTFSFSTSVTPRERAEVTDAVLATWTWTD